MNSLIENEIVSLSKLYYIIGSVTGLSEKEMDKIPIEQLEQSYLFICELSKKHFGVINKV